MNFETQLFLVIEVDVSVAAIFLKCFVLDGAGSTCVFGLCIDEGTCELLSVIPLVFVEPSAAIGHFQVCFTEQIAIFRECSVEPFVTTRVQGNIG